MGDDPNDPVLTELREMIAEMRQWRERSNASSKLNALSKEDLRGLDREIEQIELEALSAEDSELRKWARWRPTRRD